MKLIILFFLILISSSVYAIDGCVSTANNIMYTQRIGMSNNYRGGAARPSITLPAGCYWIYVIPSSPCNVNSGPGAGPGFLANTVYDCDIDTNILFLLVGALGLGGFVIRKKNNIAFSN
ncbi:hypothetical protein [Pedobacter cryotolerans]|uniref:Secreted protein with PEP-CTERM sorting signal n=1 Tax=Pedobacter cryotolerans TaxID=2571270 RepID=A0A4U1BY44_9SPHI|nr:hypothetical protein [Pedobacter cryotolerans]TKB97374.1 hypothetical protein FA045_16610 [Pedobacter cryotolerans]